MGLLREPISVEVLIPLPVFYVETILLQLLYPAAAHGIGHTVFTEPGKTRIVRSQEEWSSNQKWFELLNEFLGRHNY